jgi:hypothetical protein
MFRFMVALVVSALCSSVFAAVRVERVRRIEFNDAEKFAQLLNGPFFFEWFTLNSFRISEDGQRLLLPSLKENATGQYVPARDLIDRQTGNIVPISVPTQSGVSLPPLQIDAMSGNGQFVVGRNQDGNLFRWSEATGAELLQGASGLARGRGVAISNDGQRIVGNEDFSGLRRGFEWTSSSLVQPFTVTQTLPDGRTFVGRPTITNMSDDGSTLLLSGDLGLPTDLYSMINESEIAPGVWYLRDFSDVSYLVPPLLSSDGSIIAYSSRFGDENRLKSGDQWGPFRGASRGSVSALSPNGDVVGTTSFFITSGRILFPLLSFDRDDPILLEDGSFFTKLDRYLPSSGDSNSRQLGVYDIAGDDRTLLVVRGLTKFGPFDAAIEVFTVSIPEVPGSWMVGIGILGALIIARWRRSLN